MHLSVIIPNYNGEELLKNNLPKVFEAISLYKDGKVDVVVVDDCSADNSLSALEDLKSKMDSAYPDVVFKIIKNEKNLGFSSNINKGVRNAVGDILFLLNTDVVPEKDFLKPLLRHFVDKKVFAVGCMDKSIENGKIVLRGRGLGKWKKGFFIHSRGEVNKTNTLWVNGGSGAFRKSIWDRLGGFNELYNPFYWEDIDLSYRAIKSGYKIIFEPKSIVIHEHEKGVIKSTYSNFKVKTIAYRNQFIFVWKNITDSSVRLDHLLWLPYHILSALLRKDMAFIKGILGAFILLPKIIKYGNKEQKLFVLKDNQVLIPFRGEK